MNRKSKDIAVCAVAVALMFALAWLPVAAFLIPVLFVACNFRWKHGLTVGVFAGAVCLMYSLLGGAANNSPGTVAVLCVIMVVPRIFVGLFASLAFSGAKKLPSGKSKARRVLPYNIAATAGVLTNTVLVVGALVLLFPDMIIFGVTARAGWWVLLLVGLGELIVINLFVPILCLTVGKALKIGEFAPKAAAAKEPEPVTEPESKKELV